MKRRLSVILAAITLGIAAQANATGADTTRPAARPPQLKEKSLNTETLIATGSMAGSPRLSARQLAALSLKSIDKNFDPQLQYRLIDTLYSGNGHYILLLGQWYDFENKAWIAAYAAPNKLIDHRQVFYDNAEGFLLVETEIKNNLITITTYNEYEQGAARKKVVQYRFGANYKLQRL